MIRSKKRFLIICAFLVLLTVFPNAVHAEVRFQTVPSEYDRACPEHGEVHSLYYKDMEEILVWTPYSYNPAEQYEVILLLHGDGGDNSSWIRKVYHLNGRELVCRNLYDWLAYENRTKPFLVASITNDIDHPEEMIEKIKAAFSFLAAHFSTYAASGNPEDIIEARHHFTLGGLSRGGIFSYLFMSREISYAANYICLSAGGDVSAVTATLETMPENTLSFYFVGVGVGDNLFWWRSKNAYDSISPFAEKAEFVEYGYQHDWLTWSNAIYDALTDLLACPSEDEAL